MGTMNMSIRIKSVEQDGLGSHLGLKPGDRLLKINGRKVQDLLDYQYRITDASPELELEIGGQREVVAVEKDEDSDLGVEFEDFTIRSCANDCVFCFVDQNPAGLRKGLYFRDGDYRLSFLYGHYITMTNMGTRDLERIVEQRLSPLYISVHATEPELRRKLFLYGKDDHLLAKLHYLVDHGIELHAQVVLCPTLNDGQHLRRTLDDLSPLSPGLRSVSIVPVGLTEHRESLPEIPRVTQAYAEAFMVEYELLDRAYRHADGGRFVIPSDEWYILTGGEVPPASFYEGMAIEENGVGQVRAFLDRFEKEQRKLPRSLNIPTRFTIATGVLAGSIFHDHIISSLNSIENLTVTLEVIHNTLFGTSVTVAGLLPGRAFVEQLSGKELGSAVWTTHRILNDSGEFTLDDMTPAQISERLGVPFYIAEDSILDLVQRGIHG
jgi:putative radical SAM enzyme (TIGR03279 family)